MINKLTLTPNTKYGELSDAQKELWERAHEGASMVSGIARMTQSVDNVEGDMDPAVGSIHFQTQQDTTYMENKMKLKDPDKKEFDLKNIQSFESTMVNGMSGEFAKMNLQNDVSADINGDGANENGMMVSILGGVADQSGKAQVQSATQVFFNDNGQSITILEQAPDIKSPKFI
jgi:hypothetical protein